MLETDSNNRMKRLWARPSRTSLFLRLGKWLSRFIARFCPETLHFFPQKFRLHEKLCHYLSTVISSSGVFASYNNFFVSFHFAWVPCTVVCSLNSLIIFCNLPLPSHTHFISQLRVWGIYSIHISEWTSNPLSWFLHHLVIQSNVSAKRSIT